MFKNGIALIREMRRLLTIACLSLVFAELSTDFGIELANVVGRIEALAKAFHFHLSALLIAALIVFYGIAELEAYLFVIWEYHR